MVRSSKSETKRRNVLKAAGAGVGATLIAGCLTGGGNGGNGNGGNGNGNGNGGNGNGNGESDDPIVISSLQPLSGPFSVYGPRHRDGAEFAAQQINADGGVLGREIQIQTVDTESSGEAAATSFTQAIEQEGAVAGIGPGASEAAIRASNIAEEMEVPMYLHAAGAVEVVPQDSRYTFRTALPATPTVGRAQAQIIEEEDTTTSASYSRTASGATSTRRRWTRTSPTGSTSRWRPHRSRRPTSCRCFGSSPTTSRCSSGRRTRPA